MYHNYSWLNNISSAFSRRSSSSSTSSSVPTATSLKSNVKGDRVYSEISIVKDKMKCNYSGIMSLSYCAWLQVPRPRPRLLLLLLSLPLWSPFLFIFVLLPFYSPQPHLLLVFLISSSFPLCFLSSPPPPPSSFGSFYMFLLLLFHR